MGPRKRYSRHGQPLENAHCAKLRYNESISSFLAKLGGNCVAHERYSDGTLYFSGSVTAEQAAALKVTAKPGWKPEIRRSRTLSLFVKTDEGVAAPAMNVDDAVDLVRQSCLREAMPMIELVRVANTHSKTSHVFVQFEGETLARSYVNKVDAMPYVHRQTGMTVHVHASQLNAFYEYEPESSGSDPLVWYNPDYVGKRCVSVCLRGKGKRALGRMDLAATLDRALKGLLHEAVEKVRRVDMERTGVYVVLHARPGVDAGALSGALERQLPDELCGLSLQAAQHGVCVSRRGDYELADQTVWAAANALPVPSPSSPQSQSPLPSPPASARSASSGATGRTFCCSESAPSLATLPVHVCGCPDADTPSEEGVRPACPTDKAVATGYALCMIASWYQ